MKNKRLDQIIKVQVDGADDKLNEKFKAAILDCIEEGKKMKEHRKTCNGCALCD